MLSLSFQFTATRADSTELAATPMVCSVPVCESAATVSYPSRDHLYATMASPRKLKSKLNDSTVELESCNKKPKLKQQKSKRLKRKISTFSSVDARLEVSLYQYEADFYLARVICFLIFLQIM